jgi:hypothetical protein
MDWKHQRLTAALTKAQVEQSPNIDTDKPVSRQHETAYYGYYGYAPYWAGSYLWGASPYPYLGAGPALSAEDLARARSAGTGRPRRGRIRTCGARTR